MQNKKRTIDFRCHKCNRLLAKVNYGSLEIKCSRCKAINHRVIGMQAKAS